MWLYRYGVVVCVAGLDGVLGTGWRNFTQYMHHLTPHRRPVRFECQYEDAEDDDPDYQQGIAYLEKLEEKEIRKLRDLKRQRARIPIFDEQLPSTVCCSVPRLSRLQFLSPHAYARSSSLRSSCDPPPLKKEKNGTLML